ncbi:hypothetical protein BDV12DRAFT_189152 [Aspergillus spectabilis]
MVGVAGKSKGCNTCRKRKIACDQQKPVCVKCTRSKRVCGGYQRETVFVLSPSMSPQGIAGCTTTSSSAFVVRGSGKESTHSFTDTSTAYTLLNSHIERHNLVQAFLLNCFPSQPATSSHSWIPLLGELPTKGEALELSSTAVAASAIGHMFHHRALVKLSLGYYTRALHQLRQALRDPSLAREDGTLAACMALSQYEALECPNLGSEGYFNHCHGLIALVQARGCAVHSAGAGHWLFLGVRVPAILFALKHNHSTILFESSWMEQPWAGISKTPHDRVTNCLAQAPLILERVRSLFYLSIRQQIDLVHELIRECWQIDEQLEGIGNETQRSTSDDLIYWQFGHLFPVVFWFRDAQVAATLMLLWAARTMLWSGLSNLYQHLECITPFLGPHSDQTSVLEVMKTGISYPLKSCGEYLSMAHRVCQSVEYSLKDETLLAGPLFVSPALGIVADSLRNLPGHGHGLEIAWIQAALEVVRRKGIRVLQHVKL